MSVCCWCGALPEERPDNNAFSHAALDLTEQNLTLQLSIRAWPSYGALNEERLGVERGCCIDERACESVQRVRGLQCHDLIWSVFCFLCWTAWLLNY